MGERVTFLERKGETTVYIQTRKAWTPRDSSRQELPLHAFTLTHRKPSECHVQSPQSKTREARTSELETHVQKASSERRAGRNSRAALENKPVFHSNQSYPKGKHSSVASSRRTELLCHKYLEQLRQACWL